MSHTNNELALMLSGRIPLAWFYDEVSCLPDEEIIPECAFSASVQDGTILRAEFVLESSYIGKLKRNARIQHVLFCVPDEERRIPAFTLLLEQFNITGQWNETLERMQGIL